MEALSLEVASAGQQSVSAPRQQKHPSLKDVWRVAWTNCAWVQALWRDLLCVGFAKQLWKVYVHDMPRSGPPSACSCTAYCSQDLTLLCLRTSCRLPVWGSFSHTTGAHLVCTLTQQALNNICELLDSGIYFCPVAQALRSWMALKAVFRDRMFQFWLKFW